MANDGRFEKGRLAAILKMMVDGRFEKGRLAAILKIWLTAILKVFEPAGQVKS